MNLILKILSFVGTFFTVSLSVNQKRICELINVKYFSSLLCHYIVPCFND